LTGGEQNAPAPENTQSPTTVGGPSNDDEKECIMQADKQASHNERACTRGGLPVLGTTDLEWRSMIGDNCVDPSILGGDFVRELFGMNETQDAFNLSKPWTLIGGATKVLTPTRAQTAPNDTPLSKYSTIRISKF
jgi:hypothetical protein